MRPHFATAAALARALRLAGRRDEARVVARRALASGVRDPHVLNGLADAVGDAHEGVPTRDG
jgi:hypothetical protein